MTVLVAAGGLVGAVAAAPAAGAAGCSGSGGVTVVVDFASLGGGVQVGCAPGSPGNGLAALAAAGFGYSFVPRQPGLVCQIDNRPDPCNGASTTAYWSYWHGRPGGAWTYSTQGAGTFEPPPGSVEGWAFGSGQQPAIGPPSRPAPPRTSAPAPRPSSPPAASHPAPPATGTHAAPPATASTRHPTPPPTTSGSTPPAAGPAPTSTSPPPSSTAPVSGVTAGPVAQRRSSGVSPGLIAGLVLIAGLTTLALLTWRRRARGSP